MLLDRFKQRDLLKGELQDWTVHTQDRPFNDHRYAVNGSKLMALGWTQKTSIQEGLDITVDWYRRFGSSWWGDIESRLTPFPDAPLQDKADTATTAAGTIAATATSVYSMIVGKVEPEMRNRSRIVS